MRHFRNELIAHGITVHYTALAGKRFEDRGRRHADLWAKGARGLRPSKPIATPPGNYRIHAIARASRCARHGAPDTRRPTFLLRLIPPMPGRRIRVDWCRKLSTSGCASATEFCWRRTADRGRQMELRSRRPRRFSKARNGRGKPPLRFEPDAIIHDALTRAAAGFVEHRGYFDVPVTRTQARVVA